MKDNYKRILLFFPILYLSLILLTACNKDDDNTPTKQTGNLKASISYSALQEPSNPSFRFYLKDNLKVELYKDGTLIATQFTNGSYGDLDFGQLEYGEYQFRIRGEKWAWHNSSGTDSKSDNIFHTEYYILDAPVKRATISFAQ